MNLVTMALVSVIALAVPQGANNGFKVEGSVAKTMTVSSLAKAEKSATAGVVSADKKTLSFAGADVHIVVRTGPEEDMLSYRIQGLRNPTIKVAAGSKLTVLFVNSDEDMFHNFRVTDKAPRYDAKMTGVTSIGSKELRHRTAKAIFGEEMAFRTPKSTGNYYYVCTVAGHAAAGMYGAIRVQ